MMYLCCRYCNIISLLVSNAEQRSLLHGAGKRINHHVCSRLIGKFKLINPGFLTMFSMIASKLCLNTIYVQYESTYNSVKITLVLAGFASHPHVREADLSLQATTTCIRENTKKQKKNKGASKQKTRFYAHNDTELFVYEF